MVRFTVRCAAGLHQQRQFAQDFVECQLREERQGALDHQPLLRCERQKFGLIARIQHHPALNPPPIPAGGFRPGVVGCCLVSSNSYCRLEPWPIRRVTGSEDVLANF